jgi:hypothetical protein
VSSHRNLWDELQLNRARLEAFGAVIEQWEEYEAQELLPAGTGQRRIEPPEVSRELAEQMHRDVLEFLEELEAAWERRN